jgi:hypothetical protein
MEHLPDPHARGRGLRLTPQQRTAAICEVVIRIIAGVTEREKEAERRGRKIWCGRGAM